MPYFMATYTYTDDPGRMQVRPTHREFLARQASLLASGPTTADVGGPDGALLLFEAGSVADVEALLDQDPFAQGGFVASRSVVGWDIILGRWAETK